MFLRIEESIHFTNNTLFGKIRLTIFEEIWNNVIDFQLVPLNLLYIDPQQIDTTAANIFDPSFILFHQHIAYIFELFFHLDQCLELNSINQTADDTDDHVHWIYIIHFVFDWKQLLLIKHPCFISLLEMLYKSVMILAIHRWHEPIDFLVDDFQLTITKDRTGRQINVGHYS